MKSALLFFALTASVAVASSHHKSLPIHTRNVAGADDYEITERDYDEFINLDDRDTEGWMDIDSVGIMMERDVSPAELTSLQKRSAEVEGMRTRDLGQDVVDLALDERGEIIFPRSWEEVRNGARRLSKRVGTNFKAVITWYTGHDLLNPACQNKSRWNPSDKSLIAAVTQVWSGKPKCGQYLKLKAKSSSKTVTVRVIDACGGCKENVPHVDLTKAAFSKLYALVVGEVSAIQIKKVSAPFSDYTKSRVAIYGPKTL